ncbi:MAG: hypothetical protein AAF959_18055 [Cyanobacteria bacterium P01_D01_bin.56]
MMKSIFLLFTFILLNFVWAEPSQGGSLNNWQLSSSSTKTELSENGFHENYASRLIGQILDTTNSLNVEDPQSLNLGTSQTGVIGNLLEDDNGLPMINRFEIFRFNVTEISEVSFGLSDRRGRGRRNDSLYLKLSSSWDNRLIAESTHDTASTAGADASINKILEPGEYLLEVGTTSSSETQYSLRSRLRRNQNRKGENLDPNGSFETAEFFFKGNIVFEDLGRAKPFGRDQVDVYYFSGGSSEYDITLSGLSSNADLFLYSGDKELIGSSTENGRASEKIVISLQGKNYLAVRLNDDSPTQYALKISDIGRISDKDGSPELANVLEPGETVFSRIGGDEIHGRDLKDFYSFSLDESSLVNVLLSNLQTSASLEILNSSGRRANVSDISGIEPRSLEQELGPGKYYAVVNSVGSNETAYNLALSLKDPDDSLARARFLRPQTSVSGSIGNRDLTDYYQFIFEQPFLESDPRRLGFEIAFEPLPDKSNIQLFDESSSLREKISTLNSWQNQPINDGFRILNPDTGRYFVAIESKDDQEHTYGLSLLPIDYDGIPEKAREWKLDEVVEDEIGGLIVDGLNSLNTQDSRDIYKFSIDEVSDLSIAVNSISDVSLDVYSDLSRFQDDIPLGSSGIPESDTQAVFLNGVPRGEDYLVVVSAREDRTPYVLKSTFRAARARTTGSGVGAVGGGAGVISGSTPCDSEGEKCEAHPSECFGRGSNWKVPGTIQCRQGNPVCMAEKGKDYCTICGGSCGGCVGNSCSLNSLCAPGAICGNGRCRSITTTERSTGNRVCSPINGFCWTPQEVGQETLICG